MVSSSEGWSRLTEWDPKEVRGLTYGVDSNCTSMASEADGGYAGAYSDPRLFYFTRAHEGEQPWGQRTAQVEAADQPGAYIDLAVGKCLLR